MKNIVSRLKTQIFFANGTVVCMYLLLLTCKFNQNIHLFSKILLTASCF